MQTMRETAPPCKMQATMEPTTLKKTPTVWHPSRKPSPPYTANAPNKTWPYKLSFRKFLHSNSSSTTPRAPPPKFPPAFSFHLIHPVSPCTHHSHLHTSNTVNQHHLRSSITCQQHLSTCHHHHQPCPPTNHTTQPHHHNTLVAALGPTATVPIGARDGAPIQQVDNATTHPILSNDTTTGCIATPVVLTPHTTACHVHARYLATSPTSPVTRRLPTCTSLSTNNNTALPLTLATTSASCLLMQLPTDIPSINVTPDCLGR